MHDSVEELHGERRRDLQHLAKYRVIKSRRIQWARHVACMAERRGACMDLVVKPEGKRSLRKARRRGEYKVTVDLRRRFGKAWTELVSLRTGTGGERL